MKVTGEAMIFANDKGYSTTVSNKKEDGTYDNMFVAVNLKRGVVVENKTKIDIIDGFLSFYKTKDGLAKPKIVVMDFNIKSNPETTNNDFEISSNSDLPF